MDVGPFHQYRRGVGLQVVKIDIFKTINAIETGIFPAQGVAQADHPTLAYAGIFVSFPVPVKEVSTSSQRPVEQIRFGETQPKPVGNGAHDSLGFQLLPPAKEVVLTDFHHAHHPIRGAVTRAESESTRSEEHTSELQSRLH